MIDFENLIRGFYEADHFIFNVGISTAQSYPYQNFGKYISATAYSFSK